MRWWQYILIPFGLVFGLIAAGRRWLYSIGVFRRTKSRIPSVVVGNLQVGGAGKTPFTIWLAMRLQTEFRLAVLSRGYGRSTTGFRKVDANDTAELVGDEPLEIRHAISGSVMNYVSEKRIVGIEKIVEDDPSAKLVLLDDAFQHLSLRANVYLLLTEKDTLFTHDFPMPAGRLREFAAAAKHADAIVVTKCPPDLSTGDALDIYYKLSKFGRPVYFSAYENVEPVPVHGVALEPGDKVYVVSGLANNQAFAGWAGSKYTIAGNAFYRDHYAYTLTDFQRWFTEAQRSGAKGILTTRKDYMRMKAMGETPIPIFYSFTQPFLLFGGEDDLIQLILKRIG